MGVCACVCVCVCERERERERARERERDRERESEREQEREREREREKAAPHTTPHHITTLHYTTHPAFFCKLSLRGTPAYLSPEALTDQPLTLRSDVFSFAILMWELIVWLPPSFGIFSHFLPLFFNLKTLSPFHL